MVNIDDIEKVFSSIINKSVKCSQRLRLQNSLFDTMSNFGIEARNKSKEVAVFMNDDGDVITTKEGGESEIEFDSKYFKKIFQANDNKPYNIDHNHPNPYGSLFPVCFSYADLERLVDYGNKEGFLCKSMNVVDGFNFSRMSIVRGDDFKRTDKKDYLDIAKDFEKDMIKLNSVYNAIRDDLVKKTIEYTDFSKMTPNEASDFFIKTNIDISRKTVQSMDFDSVIREYKQQFREVNCNLVYETVDYNEMSSDTFVREYMNTLKKQGITL